ncbi:MAG: hypothetical protein KGN34_16900 [Sphingomonadales bacterium]|nr:hypothetical protein [Sphingomonadales bacterium]
MWARGDATGLAIPADRTALREGGAAWLTAAFHAMGTLAAADSVAAITRCDPFQGGGTGAKALLSVRLGGGATEDLFVKFSRNFDDAAMDAPRAIMLPEVRLAALSRQPGFPVAVPECRFADFEEASGTGVLITRRIAFGAGGIEPQSPKCMDHAMPRPLAHYRALVATLARLAGSHKAGRLPPHVEQAFPFDPARAQAADRLPWDAAQRANRVARYAAFAREFPQLLPDELRSDAFLARFAAAFEHHAANEDAIARQRHADPRLIALCHWNANVDNAWFWSDEAGELRCGLLDWGNVGQIPLAMALWGCLSGAPPWLWRDHLDELLALFAAEYARSGGPQVAALLLRWHLSLTVMTMGLRWLLDAPPRIRREVPDLAQATGPLDPRVLASETARTQLQMLTNFLAFAVA